MYQINTLEYSLLSLSLILASLNKIRASLIYLPYYKVGNFGQFDDKTLFGNKSNLHTKIAFTHNISRWTHNFKPVGFPSALQWSTHSVFSLQLCKKFKCDGQNSGNDASTSKVASLPSSPLGLNVGMFLLRSLFFNIIEKEIEKSPSQIMLTVI